MTSQAIILLLGTKVLNNILHFLVLRQKIILIIYIYILQCRGQGANAPIIFWGEGFEVDGILIGDYRNFNPIQ